MREEVSAVGLCCCEVSIVEWWPGSETSAAHGGGDRQRWLELSDWDQFTVKANQRHMVCLLVVASVVRLVVCLAVRLVACFVVCLGVYLVVCLVVCLPVCLHSCSICVRFSLMLTIFPILPASSLLLFWNIFFLYSSLHFHFRSIFLATALHPTSPQRRNSWGHIQGRFYAFRPQPNKSSTVIKVNVI